MFLGRRKELALLEAEHAASRSAMVVLYGRRRVGKSELLLEFLRPRRGLYFVGKQAPGPLQLRELAREAARVLDEPLLANLPAERAAHLQLRSDVVPVHRRGLVPHARFG